jgi:hypothetical protein
MLSADGFAADARGMSGISPALACLVGIKAPTQNSLEHPCSRLNGLGLVVSFIVSFDAKTHKSIVNKGRYAVKVTNR